MPKLYEELTLSTLELSFDEDSCDPSTETAFINVLRKSKTLSNIRANKTFPHFHSTIWQLSKFEIAVGESASSKIEKRKPAVVEDSSVTIYHEY